MNFAAAIVSWPKLTNARAKKIFKHFKNPEAAWGAELNELVLAGLDAAIADEFLRWRETFSVERLTLQLENENIKTTTLDDPTYPKLLREISDPPPLLFYRGRLPESGPAVSVVGTRRCTDYGRQAAKKIATNLTVAGVTIVSGLALGIDGVAHEAALENGGITIAVLGGSVDRRNIYPSPHQPLADRIVENNGAVVSEYAPGFEHNYYSFPARNRIIAGLSLGTLIAEAPLSSGALITAARCLDYNREVFVVPHPIGSESGAGCNELLKKGAQLVTSAEDILDTLQLRALKKLPLPDPIEPTNPLESKLFPLLREPRHVDELIKLSGLPSHAVISALTLLEIKGKIRNTGAMAYVLA